jgi:hypothetical protein
MKLRNKYKRNLQLLLWGSLLFFLLCYKLAFKRTFQELRSFKENSQQLALLQDAPLQIQIIDSKLKEIEGGIGTVKDQSANCQEILLEYSNKLPEDSQIIINELPKSIATSKDGFLITNQQIVFQGPYIELVKLLRSLEKEKSIGNICSVTFYNQKEGKSSSNYLKMRVYFQSIKSEQ